MLLETAGAAGAAIGPVELGSEALDVTTPFLEARAPTIYGGANQIQRNILARQWLDLPA
jgi:alkylation response protein AidB-like acyl-CoA dehydrogenase